METPDNAQRRSTVIKLGFLTSLVLSVALVVYFTVTSITRPHADWGIAVEFGILASALWVLLCLPLAGLTTLSWRHIPPTTRFLGIVPLAFPLLSMVLAGSVEEVVRFLSAQ